MAASQAAMSAAPLAGIVVLDLTQIYNGPYATFLMAAAGAEVIKIEPPEGEHLRRRAEGLPSQLPYAMLNAGKQSLKLDLKQAAGRDLLLQLVEKADVLVENFAAGVMDRLDLGVDALRARNRRLIIASSTGYGSDGPYRDYPAMDLTIQAMSGIIGATGFPEGPPVKAGPAVCDFQAGIHLYGAITTALFQRERTGHAATVEVSMMEAAYFPLASNLGMVHAAAGAGEGAGAATPTARTGNRHGALSLCPYNVYPASDGYLAIIVNNDRHWQALTAAFGFPAMGLDPRYRSNALRVKSMQEVDDLVASWTAPLTREAAFERLIAAQVPCAPVRDLAQVMNDPHLFARGALRRVEHPQYGAISVAASPLRFDGAVGLPERPSVPLGQDTREILEARLGLSATEIERLFDAGVV